MTRRDPPTEGSVPPRKLVIMGGQGNGTVVASTVEDLNDQRPTYDLIGFLNDGRERDVNGYPVLGPIDRTAVQELLSDPEVDLFWSLVSVKLGEAFQGRLRELDVPRERFATVIHPTAVVSRFATIGHGVAIQPLAQVGPNVRIGDHVHVFAQAMIGHDATLADFSYVSNNACIGAGVILHEGAYVGTNAATLEGIELGPWSLVGMGSVVLRSVPARTKVVGNPARTIGER